MNSPTLPPTPAKTGRGRKKSGPVPALALKLGSVLTTLSVFGASFGYASTHLYLANAPLQPAVAETAVADDTSSTTSAATTSSSSTTATSTTTLTSSVRTTTRTAVTSTKSS